MGLKTAPTYQLLTAEKEKDGWEAPDELQRKVIKKYKKKNLKQRIIKHANKKDWWEAPDELQKNFTEKQLKQLKEI